MVMAKLSGKALQEKVEGITQRGEAVPGGYTFNPRQDPPLFPTKADGANRPQNEPQQSDKDASDGDAGQK